MDIKKVEEFAKKNGFDKVKYLGVYKGRETYKPLHNTDKLQGYPFFIFIIDNEPKLVVDSDLKILEHFTN